MGMITVRGIDESVLRALHERATAAGRSVEEEVRAILEQTVTPRRQDFWDRMRRRRAGYGDRLFSDSTDILGELREERAERLERP